MASRRILEILFILPSMCGKGFWLIFQDQFLKDYFLTHQPTPDSRPLRQGDHRILTKKFQAYFKTFVEIFFIFLVFQKFLQDTDKVIFDHF